ncbi:type IV pilus assembly protein FimV [Ramlibacter sp.]|uniref:type IV pilus assembly protein FimV n=1 Tax=Ramlibacter sp. TaxID=1917967 RepID=UPI003D0ADE6D
MPIVSIATLAMIFLTLVGLGEDATALGLGRIAVQSHSGEPVRAEVELPDVTADDAAALQIGVAPAETFRKVGLDLHPALEDAEVSVVRRDDGRYVARVATRQPVDKEFVDLLLRARWPGGEVVRDYTLWFQPAPPSAPAVAPAPPAGRGRGPARESREGRAGLEGRRGSEVLQVREIRQVREGCEVCEVREGREIGEGGEGQQDRESQEGQKSPPRQGSAAAPSGDMNFVLAIDDTRTRP